MPYDWLNQSGLVKSKLVLYEFGSCSKLVHLLTRLASVKLSMFNANVPRFFIIFMVNFDSSVASENVKFCLKRIAFRSHLSQILCECEFTNWWRKNISNILQLESAPASFSFPFVLTNIATVKTVSWHRRVSNLSRHSRKHAHWPLDPRPSTIARSFLTQKY